MYTFTKLHDRRIPKVRVGVGVGPNEFKLISAKRAAWRGQGQRQRNRQNSNNILLNNKDQQVDLHQRVKSVIYDCFISSYVVYIT